MRNELFILSLMLDGSRKGKKKVRAPVSMTASYTSTKVEEIIALVRALHSIEAWNPYVNSFICLHLAQVKDMMAEPQVAVSYTSVLSLRNTIRNTSRPRSGFHKKRLKF